MEKSFYNSLLCIIMLLFTQTGFTQSASHNDSGSFIISTEYITLSASNTPDPVRKKLETAIDLQLKQLPYARISKDRFPLILDNLSENERYNLYLQQTDSQSRYLISGTVVYRKYKPPKFGSDPEDEYLSPVIYEYLTVTIDLYDFRDHELILSLTRDFELKDDNLNMEIAAIFNEVSLYFYYIPESGTANIASQLPKRYLVDGGFQFNMPVASYSNIVGNGFGFYLGGAVSNLFYNHLILGTKFSFISASPVKENISSYYLFMLSVYAGYSYPVHRKILISPQLELGFMEHLISGSYYYGDTFITPSLLFGVMVYKNTMLTFTAGYSFFFEQGYIGQIMQLDTGVRYRF